MSFSQKYKTPKVLKAFGDKNQFLIKNSGKRKAKGSQLKARSYKGIFPCFFLGKFITLFSNILKARINFWRVSEGKITSSI